MLLIFSFTIVSNAAEKPSESKQQLMTEVNELNSNGLTTVWSYEADDFKKGYSDYFTSSVSGRVKVLLGGVPLNGQEDGEITLRLFAKGAFSGNYGELDSITVDADGTPRLEYIDATLYNGDECMVSITSTSGQQMVVVASIHVEN